MELGSISKLLSGSKYAEHAKEIEAQFNRLGITTLDALDNAPIKLGPKTMRYSTYSLCAYLRQAAIQAVVEGSLEVEIPEPEPEPLPEPEPEPEEVPEERSSE